MNQQPPKDIITTYYKFPSLFALKTPRFTEDIPLRIRDVPGLIKERAIGDKARSPLLNFFCLVGAKKDASSEASEAGLFFVVRQRYTED